MADQNKEVEEQGDELDEKILDAFERIIAELGEIKNAIEAMDQNMVSALDNNAEAIIEAINMNSTGEF